MNRVFFLLTAVIITMGSAMAQNLQQRRNELSISAAGGISSLQYDLSAGKHNMGFGGQAGLGYSFFFSPYWGLGTGVEISLYRAKSTLSGFDLFAVTHDNFIYNYKLNNYSETQQAFYINIPLMMQYQTGGKQKFYAALGGKIGFPVKATAKTNNYMVRAQFDDPQQSGTDTYYYASTKTDLDKLGINLMASAEMGVKWKIRGKNALYTGIYADYGFNNIQKTNDKTFMQGTLTEANLLSPMIESQHAGTPFTANITPLAVGVKVKFALSFGKSDRRTARRTAEDVIIREVISIEKVSEEPPFVDNFFEEAEAARQQAIRDEIQKPIEQYDLSATALNASQKWKLNKKIALLKQNPDIEVFIHGHTCETGGDVINEKIGQQRAEKARAYMISKGIDEKRILGTASRRDLEPVVPNTSEENRRINRRIEILVR